MLGPDMIQFGGKGSLTNWKSRFWPLGLLLVGIFVSSSTVVTSKQFVKGIADYSPVRVTEAQFSIFWNEWWWMFVKGWHATEYVLVFLVLRHALVRDRTRLAVLATAFFAASDEIHQIWVPRRGGRISDWLIDLLGVSFCVAWFEFAKRESMSRAGRFVVLGGLAVGLIGVLRLLALNPFP